MASISEMIEFAKYAGDQQQNKTPEYMASGVSGFMQGQANAEANKLAIAMKMIEMRQKKAEADLAEKNTQMFNEVYNQVFNIKTPTEKESTPSFDADKSSGSKVADIINGIGMTGMKISSKGGAEIDYSQPKTYAGTTDITPRDSAELKKLSDYFVGKDFEVGKPTNLKTSEYTKFLGNEKSTAVASEKKDLDLINKAEDNARLKNNSKKSLIKYPESLVGQKEAYVREGLAKLEAYKELGIEPKDKEAITKRVKQAYQYIKNTKGTNFKFTSPKSSDPIEVKDYQPPSDIEEEMRVLTSGSVGATPQTENNQSGKVKVISPEGTEGMIPKSQLDAALNQGYKLSK